MSRTPTPRQEAYRIIATWIAMWLDQPRDLSRSSNPAFVAAIDAELRRIHDAMAEAAANAGPPEEAKP